MEVESTPQSNLETILRRRLKGDPVRDCIAKDLGISRQYIHAQLAKLPKGEADKARSPVFSEDEEVELALEYLRAYPSKTAVRSFSPEKLRDLKEYLIAKLAKEHNCDRADILNVFYKFSDYHPMVQNSEYYRAVSAWRAKEAVSLKAFAKLIGHTTPDARGILRGWNHLPLASARKIQSASGLTITDIYSDLLELDATASKNREENQKGAV